MDVVLGSKGFRLYSLAVVVGGGGDDGEGATASPEPSEKENSDDACSGFKALGVSGFRPQFQSCSAPLLMKTSLGRLLGAG